MTYLHDHFSFKCGIRMATLIACFGLALPATAASNDNESWQFDLTPYLWLAGMKGDTQIRNGPVASLDVSPSEVLDMLDFGLMGSIEARHGRWGIFTDLVYAKLSDSGSIAKVRGKNGIRVDADADAEVKTTTVQLALTYRAVDGETPIDLFFGGRYNKQDIDTNLNLTALGAINVTANPQYDHSWWDPYVGVRVSKSLTGKLKVTAYGDIGGFGVGADTTWQAMLGGSYQFTDSIAATFGYRVLDTDYDNDGFKYDIKLDGIYLGANFRF